MSSLGYLLHKDDATPFSSPTEYRKFTGALQYLSHTPECRLHSEQTFLETGQLTYIGPQKNTCYSIHMAH